MNSGRRWKIATVCGIALALAVAVRLFVRDATPPQSPLSPFADVKRAQTAVPVLFEAPTFDFVDQDGRRARKLDLGGRIWIADFIFTSCAGSCPKVTSKFVDLQKAIDDPEIRFVTFSVDPERDDPRTLKDYGASHNAAETRWMLLRPPDRQTITQVARKMAAMARSPDANDTIMHTDFFILVDEQGKVRGLYDSKSQPNIERLKADVATLARQRLLDRAPAHPTSSPAGG